MHLLKNLKPKKAAGPDKIKPVVLQELKEEMASMLKLFFERSLESGTVPSIWTSANFSPLFKKGDKSTAANYRPISLTCILCKVMEHIIASNVARLSTRMELCTIYSMDSERDAPARRSWLHSLKTVRASLARANQLT